MERMLQERAASRQQKGRQEGQSDRGWIEKLRFPGLGSSAPLAAAAAAAQVTRCHQDDGRRHCVPILLARAQALRPRPGRRRLASASQAKRDDVCWHGSCVSDARGSLWSGKLYGPLT